MPGIRPIERRSGRALVPAGAAGGPACSSWRGLGVIALYLLLQPARPDNIYFELQRQASLVYLGFWAAIALLGALLALIGERSSWRSTCCC